MHPMAQLRLRLRNMNLHPSLDTLQRLWNEVGAEAILSEERARIRCVLWDRQSPINGRPASQVLQSRNDIPPDGAVYLIQEGDRTLVFQPHDPNGGAMTPQHALEAGTRHAQEIATQRALDRITEAVAERLLLEA